MKKNWHEFRDPIHVFIRVSTDERKIIDSRPFQRLRHIHQLAMTNLVYHGATHKRFEHSLGVMELASRIFDVITNLNNIHDVAREIIPPEPSELSYWRGVLRIAALCHDLGHLPFSHAAEYDLLPDGWNHEKFTVNLIKSDEMEKIWKEIRPIPSSDDIAQIAVGFDKSKLDDLERADWKTILSEIITGKAFGADRIDYLLRDSLHTGVAYGKFDHYRLIDTLRILPQSNDDSSELSLGVEDGGIHSVEALLLARYFMFKQLYFHHVRRIYDIHLKEFLKEWLPGGVFSTELEGHLKMTDNEVNSAILEATHNDSLSEHEPAKRIVERKHFKLLYEPNQRGLKSLKPGKIFSQKAKKELGENTIIYDSYSEKGTRTNFPVLTKSEKIRSFEEITRTLSMDKPLVANGEYVFVSPEKFEEAKKWRDKNLEQILASEEREGEE